MDSFDISALRQEFGRLHQRLDEIERKIDALGNGRPSAAGHSMPATATLNVPEGVLHLLHAGQRQQAIDAYQQLAGVDARTAEAVVTSLAAAQPLSGGPRP